MSDTKKYFSPRLIDYVVIAGKRAKENQRYNINTLNNSQKKTLDFSTPELLRRYPSFDHSDFRLPHDVVFFCQPEGCIERPVTIQLKFSNETSTSFIFSLTEKDSARVRYGICINFYRPVIRKFKCQYNLKAIENSSSLKGDKNVDLSEDFAELDNNTCQKKIYSLTSICIISHHPFFSLFRECLLVLRKIIESCHSKAQNLEQESKVNKAVSDVWTILAESIDKTVPDDLKEYINEIESWIIRLLSVPAPLPGNTKIILDTLTNEMPMLFALPDHTRFSLVDFPLHLPLELLGTDLFLRILTLILLENKILFQSRDYNLLTMCIMSFVYMLYPLDYMFPVIPLLPVCMNETEQLLLAPTPFIIGIPSNFFKHKTNITLPDDVWLIDLDKNKIHQAKNSEPIPDIPEPEYTNLRNNLNSSLNSLRNDSGNQNEYSQFDDNSKMRKVQTLKTNSTSHQISGNDADSVDIAIRVSMVQFFYSKNILSNFNEHTRTLRLYPRPVVAFQYNSFIRSRPVKSNFIIKLAKTQAIEYLAEWSLSPSNVVYLRIQTGVFDPILIGDKPKWFCRHLNANQFRIYSDTSLLLTGIVADFKYANRLKDDSDSDDSEKHDKCEIEIPERDLQIPESLLNFSNGALLVHLEKLYLTSKENSLDDAISHKKKLNARSSNKNQIYLDIQNSDVENKNNNSGNDSSSFTTSSSSSSIGSTFDNYENNSFNGSPSGLKTLNQQFSSDSKSSSATLTPVQKTFSPEAFESTHIFSDVHSTFDAIKIQNSLNLTTSLKSDEKCQNMLKDANQLNENKNNENLRSFRSTTNLQNSFNKESDLNLNTNEIANVKNALREDLTAKSRVDSITINQKQAKLLSSLKEMSNVDMDDENQKFLKEILVNILEGNGVGWMKYNRIKKLMEDENNRNFVLSRINTSMDKNLSADEDHIEDVKLSKQVFKGISKLMTAIVHGVEQTYAKNGLGGMASAFQLLEIAHTHYWEQDFIYNSKNDISPTISDSSPSESKETISQLTRNKNSDQNANTEFDKISNSRKNSSQLTADSYQSNMSKAAKSEISENNCHESQVNSSSENCDENEKREVAENEKFDTSNDLKQINSFPSLSKSNSSSLEIHSKTQLVGSFRYIGGRLISVPVLNTPKTKTYLYEVLINNRRSPLWDQMQFWEDMFLDAVAQERDIIGLDQGPSEMIERYSHLGSAERRRLELDEDNLLAVMLYNFIGFMIMMRVSKDEIRRKVRRMLGKCHIGLSMSQQVYDLLEHINVLSGKDVELKPAGSRVIQKQSFTVHWGKDNNSEIYFIEVCSDCIILRTFKGEICERWWFEKLVNMTYCPKTKVLCLWHKNDGETILNKFFTKKCRDLYNSIKDSMQKAAKRMDNATQMVAELGGEFPIRDFKTDQPGVLKICVEGIWIIFGDRKELIELKHVRKCTTQKNDVFVLEEYDTRARKLNIRKYKSEMASLAIMSFHRVISVLMEKLSITNN